MLDFTLIRAQRRTASLTVLRDGTVEVRAPITMPLREIEAFVENHAAWIEEKRQRQLRRAAFAEDHFADESKIRALRAAAEAKLPALTARWAQVMGVSPTGVRITSAKTRFGSCSATDSICFSWRLMAYPASAVEYVVVHELAHIRHKNHSAVFYAFVEEFLPDWRERAAQLRNFSSQED